MVPKERSNDTLNKTGFGSVTINSNEAMDMTCTMSSLREKFGSKFDKSEIGNEVLDIAKTANSKSNESRMEMTTIFSSNSTKGQLISQCPFGVIVSKVSFFGQCSKMQLIPIKNFIIKTCFIKFLWFFRLKC